MDVQKVLDIAAVIKLKSSATKALHQECSKVCEVANTVIEVASNLKTGLKRRRIDAHEFVGPLQKIEAGVSEINKVMDVCRDEPLKANLLAKTYLSKLRLAITKINDAMPLLVGTDVSVELSCELQKASQALITMQELYNEIADDVQSSLRSGSKGILPCLLKNGVVRDIEDAKTQLEQLQAEKDDLLLDALLTESDLIESASALTADELVSIPPTQVCTQMGANTIDVPEYFKCPLSLSLMEDPVYLATCGRSFERTWLERALQENPHQDPTTGLRHEEQLTFGPNRALKDAIEAWKQQNNYTAIPPIPPAPSAGHLLSAFPWLAPIYNNDPALTSFESEDYTIGNEGVVAIATALESNTFLRILFLDGVGIGDEGAIALFTTLGRNTSLQQLYVDNNAIGPDAAAAIAAALETNTSLHILNLSGNGFGDEGVIAIARGLGTNTSLQELHLSIEPLRVCHQEKIIVNSRRAQRSALFRIAVNMMAVPLWALSNRVRAEGAQAIAMALKTNTSLHSMLFINNEIGDEGAKAIAAALDTSASLQKLHIGFNGIGDEGVKVIATALNTNASLLELHLNNNKIGIEGAKAIAAAINTKTRLQNLLLARNSIGAEGAIAFASALADNSTLQNLDIRSNSIGDEGMKSLSSALGTNTSLQTLPLYGNMIGDEGARAIAMVVAMNTSLRSLELGKNEIGDEGAEAIATTLGDNTSLHMLCLNSNKIGDEGANAIAKALGTNSSLKKLFLDYNRIGDEGAKAIAAALGTNTALRTITLSGRSIGTEGREAIVAARRLLSQRASTED